LRPSALVRPLARYAYFEVDLHKGLTILLSLATVRTLEPWDGEKERDAKTPRSVPNYDAGTAARSRVLTVEGLRM